MGVVAGAAGGELGDVERREEPVDVFARLAWPDAQQRSEDDGQEEAAEVDAARQFSFRTQSFDSPLHRTLADSASVQRETGLPSLDVFA